MTQRDARRVTIRFTDDQRRRLRSEFGEDIAEWDVDIPASPVGGVPLTAGGRPPAGVIVLTGEQRERIKEATGRTCEYIRIENWPVDKYGSPPEEAH